MRTHCIALASALALFLVCGAASAQSISIVSGNGQLACELCARPSIGSFEPLKVLVKDAAGNPVSGATVTWSFASPNNSAQATINSPTTTTGADGTASTTFYLFPNIGAISFTSYVQGNITATLSALPPASPGTTGQTVVFVESDALVDNQIGAGQNGIIEVGASLVAPSAGTSISGPAGSTLNNAIQVGVTANVFNASSGNATPNAVPGIAIFVIPPASGPSIACSTPPGGQPNVALTGSNGIATCNVVFGSVQGNGTATIAVGQPSNPFATFNVSFSVTQGQPGAIKVLSGNNQSGNPGVLLPSVLTAMVVDQAGSPLPGVNVTWGGTNVTVSPTQSGCPAASATTCIFNASPTSDANGKISAYAVMGSTPGAVTITVSVANAPSINASFTETANVNITALQIVSGNNQTAIASQAFSSPLIVQVNNGSQPVAGAAVAFAVTSGSATLSSATATTNSAGQAQVTVTAGATAGNVVITATAGSFSQTFNLTVSPPGPAITPTSFYNAASLISGAVSPCSLATIIAAGLAPGLQGAILPPLVGMLPTTVYNDSVSFLNPQTNASILAPIWDVANVNGQEQMTIQIPCELAPGNVQVTVNVGTGSKTVTLPLQPAAPGIFQTQGSDRKLRGVLLRPDGSFVTKENPARQGETVYMFVTGIGPVNPQIGTNQIGIPGTPSIVTDLSSLIVGVNNAGVQVVSANYATDLVGVYEVGFVVPTGATGDLPLAIAVSLGGAPAVFGNPSVIPVQ